MLAFKIEPSKLGKTVRQLKERSQYWGPEPIPPEHLANLKESFKGVIDAGLCKNMFSEKMEDLLGALKCWQRNIPLHFAKICEVLDMVLKWLTWVLFTTNTQTWKQALEVLNSLLGSIAATEGGQLTEREAHILVPNIVERSGHNNLAIRESMMLVLSQSMQVYSRLKMLPMLLHGLASKNKRSATCTLHTLAEGCDRQVAYQTLRSQKDVLVIVRMLDDKDMELRKAAVHFVALLSIHAEGDAFAKSCGRHLAKDTQTVVKTAAARLRPEGEASVMNASVMSISHIEEASFSRAGTPTRSRRGGSTGTEAIRPVSPLRQHAGAASSSTAANAQRTSTPTKRSGVANSNTNIEVNTTRAATPPRSAAKAGSDVTATRLASPGRLRIAPGSAASPAGEEAPMSTTRHSTPGAMTEPLRSHPAKT